MCMHYCNKQLQWHTECVSYVDDTAILNTIAKNSMFENSGWKSYWVFQFVNCFSIIIVIIIIVVVINWFIRDYHGGHDFYFGC